MLIRSAIWSSRAAAGGAAHDDGDDAAVAVGDRRDEIEAGGAGVAGLDAVDALDGRAAVVVAMRLAAVGEGRVEK